MYPILFKIGGLEVGTFGVMMVAGFVAAWLFFRLELKRKGLKLIDADMLLAAMLGGVVGAKVYFFFEYPGFFIADPVGAIFSTSGLVWYGGVAGGVAACIAVVLVHRQSIGVYADAVAPSLAIGLALGRVG